MGLLDSLGYGNQGGYGGLLDFLRTQEQYQPGAGFAQGNNQPSPLDNAQWPQGPVGAPQQADPIGVGSYQMPRMGEMSQFTPAQPDPAAIPPNAQPAQGQLPMQAPMQAAPQEPQGLPPAFGGAGSTIGRMFNPDGLVARLTGNDSRSAAQQNLKAQYEALVPMLGQQKAMLAVMNPEAGKTLIAQALEKKQYGFTKLEDGTVVRQDPMTGKVEVAFQGTGGGQTDDIKEYQFAKKEDPTLTFNKFMSQKKAVSGEFGMTPIWGTGPDGKPAVLQLGKSGDAKQSVLPQGFNLARDPIKVEGPTGTTILDPQTRQQVGFIPKDNAKKEEDEKVGQARGTAKAALANGADIDAAATMKKIDEFASSKGFNEIFGQIDQFRPSWTHSNEGTDALARYKQLKGTAFLSAYSMLKGGGAITDIEGQKAGDAMARLDRAQGEAEARAALKDFKEAVETGLMKLKRAANGGADAPATPAASTGGSVDALLKKYGG